jgi:hypothetical protein
MYSLFIHCKHFSFIFQDEVNRIFDAVKGPHRIHPVISLIGKEWQRMKDEWTEKDRPPPNFEAFSLANVIQACKLGAEENQGWPKKLHMQNLPLLLKNQECVRWWLPGAKDYQDYDNEDDEEEEPVA